MSHGACVVSQMTTFGSWSFCSSIQVLVGVVKSGLRDWQKVPVLRSHLTSLTGFFISHLVGVKTERSCVGQAKVSF